MTLKQYLEEKEDEKNDNENIEKKEEKEEKIGDEKGNEFKNNINMFLNTKIKDLLNEYIMNEAVASPNDDLEMNSYSIFEDLFQKFKSLGSEQLEMFINSNKFKFLGKLHQLIITEVDNGNSVYNRFEIDSNILNNYKQYYEKLKNFLYDITNKEKNEAMEDDYEGRIQKIKNIITDIYTKLYGRNGLQDDDDIILFFMKEEINSEENLKGNGVLKILANLAVSIHDYNENAFFAISKLAYGKKIGIGNIIIQDNSLLFDTVKHFQTISEVFGIKK